MKKWLTAACAGFLTGYLAVRMRQSLIDLREPLRPLQKDARAYGATRRARMVSGVARSLAGHVVASSIVARMPRDLRTLERPFLTALLNAAATSLESVIETPVDYAEHHLIERRYGLTDQSARDWLLERGKMTAVSVALGTLVTFGLLSLVRRFSRAWPLIATGAAPPLLILLSLVGPVYIAPIFNKFEPLRGPLEERLRKLARRYGVGDAQIVRFDMSRQTKKANAYVAGLLGTHRIAVADTLISNFTDEEIEFVVAHELGHYVGRDTWIGVAAGSLTLAILVNAAAALERERNESVASIEGFSRFSLVLQLLAVAIGPLLAAGSRAIERRADRFALSATQQPRWGIAAFERLREQNLAEDEEPRWAEVLLATHPSLRSRIAYLRAMV